MWCFSLSTLHAISRLTSICHSKFGSAYLFLTHVKDFWQWIPKVYSRSFNAFYNDSALAAFYPFLFFFSRAAENDESVHRHILPAPASWKKNCKSTYSAITHKSPILIIHSFWLDFGIWIIIWQRITQLPQNI